MYIIGDGMKKYRIILLIFICLPFIVKARECTAKEINDLRKLNSYVNFSYEYYFIDDDIYFDITYTNLNSDLYMIDSSTNIKYTLKESTIKKYKNGQTIKFVFYSKTCNNEYIGERSVSLKKYNKYYKSEYCKDILEYEYCTKWMNNNIPVAEFKKMTDDYRTKISKPVTEEVDNYKTDIQGFYLFITIIEFILFVTFISIFKQKRAKDII